MTYNFIPILYGILESERDSPNEVRSENEDGKIWVSALAKTLWTVCVYNRRDILLAVTNVGASFALRRVATARVPSEWHSRPGEQRLIKSTTLKTFCLRFSRFFQYSRISIPIPSLTLSLSVCLWFLVPSIRWTLIPDELTLMYDSGLNRLELIGNASRNLSCTVCTGRYRCHRFLLVLFLVHVVGQTETLSGK